MGRGLPASTSPSPAPPTIAPTALPGPRAGVTWERRSREGWRAGRSVDAKGEVALRWSVRVNSTIRFLVVRTIRLAVAVRGPSICTWVGSAVVSRWTGRTSRGRVTAARLIAPLAIAGHDTLRLHGRTLGSSYVGCRKRWARFEDLAPRCRLR